MPGGNFYPYQWDLNYSNPTVFNDMTENLLFLANRGVDVIRLDAIPYMQASARLSRSSMVPSWG